jgi:hypothetical protein
MNLTNSGPASVPVNAARQDNLIDVPSTSRRLFIAWFTLVVTAASVAFIWTYRFLPMMDYPMWIHAGRVFSQLIQKQAAPVYSIVYWPVPNSVFLGISGFLDLFLNPETSGKIFLSVCVVLFVLGAYRLVGSSTTRRDSPLFLLPLLYVFHRGLWVGEMNFSFSLGVLFLAIAHVCSRRDRLRDTDLWTVAGFSLLIFFSHAIAYFCWLIFLALLAVFDLPRIPRPKILFAVSPSLLLMALYVLHRGHSGAGPVESSFTAVLRSKLVFVSVFSPLHFFEPFYYSDPKPFKILATVFNLSTVAAVLALIVIWLWKAARPANCLLQNGTARTLIIAPLAFFAVFLVAPLAAATGIPDLNYRFLLPAFVVMLAGLASYSPHRRLSERKQWALTSVAAIAVITVLTFQWFYVGRIAQKLQGIHDVISQAQLSSDFRDLAYNDYERLAIPRPSGPRLFPAHDPLAYFPYYLRLEQSAPARVFSTSILRSSAEYPPLLSKSKTLTQFPSGIVILGLQSSNRLNAALMGDRYQTIADTEYVLILRRKAEVTSRSDR